jgi:hypothetical protein
MPSDAKVYIFLVTAAGIGAMVYAFLNPPWPHDLFQLCTYFVLGLLAATFKLRLPGLTGTMSIGFVVVLLSAFQLTLAESMFIACSGVLVQCLWRPDRRPKPVQVFFSVSAVALSLLLAYECSAVVRTKYHMEPVSIVLAVATCLYFMANSLLFSGVMSLVKREPLRQVWQSCYLFAFPYYLLGGVVTGIMAASGREFGWRPSLLILPVMSLIYLFYRLYLARFEVLPATAESRGV